MTNEEVTKLYKDVFKNDNGKKCLEHLQATFVDRAVFKQGLTFEETAFREGQRDIVMQILKEVSYGD